MRSPRAPGSIRDDELEALICDCLDVLLPVLPPDQANIVRAVDLERESPRFVAETLGLRLNEVVTSLSLGRQGLKDLFGELSMICPEHGLAGCDCHSKRASRI